MRALSSAAAVVILLATVGLAPVGADDSTACRLLGRAGLDRVLPPCRAEAAARHAIGAGRQALAEGDLPRALAGFRVATAHAPTLPMGHVLRGGVAEAVGELDEARAAFQAAVRLEPSASHQLLLGGVADRLGDIDLAVRSLESGYGAWRDHAAVAAGAGAAVLGVCVATRWPNVLALARECPAQAREAAARAFLASSEDVPQYQLRILVEAGRHDAAIALARRRGWIRDTGDYCEAADQPVTEETAALLAMLLAPQRADCLVDVAERLADDGLPRLARRVLADRAHRARDATLRARAAHLLRHRLPAHEVAKVAESLNVTGWRLANRLGKPSLALAVYEKAIAADPAFSWPYHNVGRLYLQQKDPARAAAWLRKALEVNPDHWRAQLNLGAAAYQLGRYDEALGAYRRALAVEPRDGRTHAGVGWTLLKLGRRAEGLRALQVAVRLDPDLAHERAYLDAAFGADVRRGPTPFSSR
jgi:tetratricopeptide (TPR) repeat protein